MIPKATLCLRRPLYSAWLGLGALSDPRSKRSLKRTGQDVAKQSREQYTNITYYYEVTWCSCLGFRLWVYGTVIQAFSLVYEVGYGYRLELCRVLSV